MADLAGVRTEVARFAGALTALALRVAAIEAALGLPRAASASFAPPAASESGGGAATDDDVARLQIVLAAYGEARAPLEARVVTLEQALAVFAPALRRALLVSAAAVGPPAAPADGGASRADLDRIQKQTGACASALAGLELRVGAAEDALDAFFGTLC
jgi:hypothetical protein